MRKVKEINDVTKLIEIDILHDDSESSDTALSHELFLSGEEQLRGARKALIWAMKVIPKKTVEKPNKKLDEFGIKNPIK